ncbi:MAG: hypothetical protein GTN69_00105, partial [Armatimonadetes bacterium]|nr:hypothetical protein [Armatimonadota bacterium]
ILANWLRPTMKIFGLPGEAAIVLLTGWFASIYAALGALNALELSSSAVTQIGLMLLICHALPMEWAVLQKMGARAARITFMRLALSVLVGVLYALLYREQVAASPISTAAFSPQTLPFSECMAKAALGCVKLLGLILAIIMPITVISEIARARKVLPRAAHRLSLFLNRFGLGESALAPLLIGLIFGIVYGAGALIALGRAGAVKPADARTVGIFLGICHSMLEDPLLFIAIGGHWFWLIVVRFLLAVILTPLLRRLA